MSKRPPPPTERTPGGWVNVYGPTADPFRTMQAFFLDSEGEREVEAARARGDQQVTLTKGAFAGLTYRTTLTMADDEDGRIWRYLGESRLEQGHPPPPGYRKGQLLPTPPWNRPAFATSIVVQRLLSVAWCPPFTLSAAAIDAARDVLDHKLVEGDHLAGGGDELVESLARGVQDALNRFVVERVDYRNPGSEEDASEEAWSDIERGWSTRSMGSEIVVLGGPMNIRGLSDAEVDVLDKLAMVDSAHGRVPWLSARLADYLRDGFGTAGAELAESWLTQEAERERARSEQVSAPNAPAFALPGWADRWRTYVTPPAFAALALAVWWNELRPRVERVAKGRERAERLRPALTHAAQAQLLAFVGSQSPRVHERNGQPIATYTLHDGAEVSVRLEGSADAAMDAATMQNLIDRGRLARLDVAHLRALDLIMNELAARLADGDMPADGVPRLELPKGKPLAERLRLGASGAKGAEADAALDYLSRIELTDGRGSLARLIAAPEARAHAPGRAGAWLVTPGELIRPTMAQNQPLNQRRWRQFVPWLDSFPDDSWLNPRQRASLGYLALRAAVFWREAAGRDHGKRWLDTPGLALTPDVLDTLTDGLDRHRTIRELEGAGWWSIKGDLLLPGEHLPRFTRDLLRAAEHAAGKAGGKARSKKRRQK